MSQATPETAKKRQQRSGNDEECEPIISYSDDERTQVSELDDSIVESKYDGSHENEESLATEDTPYSQGCLNVASVPSLLDIPTNYDTLQERAGKISNSILDEVAAHLGADGYVDDQGSIRSGATGATGDTDTINLDIDAHLARRLARWKQTLERVMSTGDTVLENDHSDYDGGTIATMTDEEGSVTQHRVVGQVNNIPSRLQTIYDKKAEFLRKYESLPVISGVGAKTTAPTIVKNKSSNSSSDKGSGPKTIAQTIIQNKSSNSSSDRRSAKGTPPEMFEQRSTKSISHTSLEQRTSPHTSFDQRSAQDKAPYRVCEPRSVRNKGSRSGSFDQRRAQSNDSQTKFEKRRTARRKDLTSFEQKSVKERSVHSHTANSDTLNRSPKSARSVKTGKSGRSKHSSSDRNHDIPQHTSAPDPVGADVIANDEMNHTRWLKNVHYITTIEDAPTDLDLSTVGPMKKRDAKHAFKKDVPREIPAMISSSSDEISSVHIPIRVYNGMVLAPPTAPPVKHVKSSRSSTDVETGGDSRQGSSYDNDFDGKDDMLCGPRSDIELFFVALISISLLILVVLLIIIVAGK